MVLSDSKRAWVKYLVTGWAFCECLLFAGTLYGWSSLVFIFKDEGIYSNLCEGLPNATHDVINETYLDSQKLDHTRIENIGNNATSQNFSTDTSNYYKYINTEDIHNTRSIYNVTHFDASNTNGGGVNRRMSGRILCKKQDSVLSLCFTVSSAIFCVSCVVMGHVNYKVGTRTTRYIAFVIFVAGALCLAFVSKEVPWLMFPGLSMIGIGGLPLFVTNNQVANLFTKGSSSVVGLLCGGYDMSAAVYLLIKIAHQNGFSRKNMFFALVGVHCMTLLSTQTFLPKYFIYQRSTPKLVDMEIMVNKPDRRTSEKLLVQESNQTGNPGRKRVSIADIQPLNSYVLQPLFITHTVWLCLLQLRFYYFIGNLNTFLNRMLNNDIVKVSYFTNVCFYTMMGGLVTSFLVGIVYDGQKSIFRKGSTKLYRWLMPALLPLSTASVLAVLLSVLVLTPTQPVLYGIFVTMTLYRSFLYSMAAAFINAVFPSQYFAMLYGITMIAAGLFSLFQYALFNWAESYSNAPFHVDIFLLGITVASLSHPLYMWYCGWREERSATTEL